MNLIFDHSLDDVQLLLDVFGEAVQRCLCMVEEGHAAAVMRGKDRAAERWGRDRDQIAMNSEGAQLDGIHSCL